MPNPEPITRIIIRRGTEQERSGVLLLQSEPGFAIDSNRLYIGDGVTVGGVPVGVRFLGFHNFSGLASNVPAANAPAVNDFVFDNTSNILYTLTAADFTLTANYRPVGINITPDNVTIQRTGTSISVKENSLNARYLTVASVGRGLERINSNQILRIATPMPELTFVESALSITPAGVQNSKLAVMPPNTFKGCLSIASTPQDVPISTLASLLQPYLTSSGSGGSGGTVTSSIPTGTVFDYAGSNTNIPTGYLLCDGSTISRSTYSALFAIIGTGYGAGDGSTTFNLPDFRGRTAIGAGQGAGLSVRARGDMVGTETHTLTENQMPSHIHSMGRGLAFSPNNGGSFRGDGSTGPNVTTGAAGGSQPHNNMQPSLVINKIIKT